MDAPYYNGDLDHRPFTRVNRLERTYGHGRCRRCGNPIVVPFEIDGYGAVCSAVCLTLVEDMREKLQGKVG